MIETGVRITVKGIPQAQRKLNYPNLMSSPLREFFERATTVIEREMKSRIRRHTGETADSIISEISRARVPKWARTGTDSPVAVFLEEGTGPGYFPNVDSITPWAEDHGIDPWGMAKRIEIMGTKAHPFVDETTEASIPQIIALAFVMGLDIEVQAVKL